MADQIEVEHAPPRAVKFPGMLEQLISDRGYSRNRKVICRRTGISAGALSQYVTGKTRPSFEILTRLADFFEVSLDYLVYGTKGPRLEALDYGPLARYIDSSLAQVQQRADSHSALVSRIAAALASTIEDVARRVTDESYIAAPGLLRDDETLVLETFSEATDLISMNLQYDVTLGGEDEPVTGRFTEVVARNLSRGRPYRFLLPSETSRDWRPHAEGMRRLLKDLAGADSVNYCAFRVAKSPVFVGVGLYRLDLPSLRDQVPVLYEGVRTRIATDGSLGYTIPPSDELQADALFDAEHLSNARESFERLWKGATAV